MPYLLPCHFWSCHFLLPCNQLIPLTWASLPISSPAGHSLISAAVYYWSTSTCSLLDCLVCFCQALQFLPAPRWICLPVWLISWFWPLPELISKLNFPCLSDYLVFVLLGSTLPVNVTGGIKVDAVMQNHQKSHSQKTKNTSEPESDGPLNPPKQKNGPEEDTVTQET